MIAVFVVGLLLVLVLAAIALPSNGDQADAVELERSAAVAARELHAIRRALEVAQLRAEGRFDAGRLRRELRDELQAVDDDQRSAGNREEVQP